MSQRPVATAAQNSRTDLEPKGAYTRPLTPVGRTGDVLKFDDGGQTYQYGRIAKVLPIPEIETEPVTVADGNRETDVDASNLEMFDGWLAQLRLAQPDEDIPDGVTIQVDQGGAQSPLYQTKEVRGEITNSTGSLTVATSGGSAEIASAAHLLEYYVLQQEAPKFTYINESGAEQEVSLTFSGFAFALQKLGGAPQDQDPYYVPVEAVSRIGQ